MKSTEAVAPPEHFGATRQRSSRGSFPSRFSGTSTPCRKWRYGQQGSKVFRVAAFLIVRQRNSARASTEDFGRFSVCAGTFDQTGSSPEDSGAQIHSVKLNCCVPGSVLITGRQSMAMIVASTTARFLLAIMAGRPRDAQTCLRKHLQLTESDAQRVENWLGTSVATAARQKGCK